MERAAGGPGFDWAGRRVLITGGLGFIGSNLARRLVALGAEVLLLDSLIPAYGGNPFNIRDVADRLRVNLGDLRDRHALPHLVRGCDVIFNLAGQTSHMDSMTDPVTDLEINAAAQLYLLDVCRHEAAEARLVFASTRQMYGAPDYLPVDEAHPLRPVDVNGINKLAGESYHLLYHRVYGLRACALRLTNTYGPRMRIKDARQTFLGIWVKLALEGRPFEVWGGEQLRDFTYVDDVVDAFLAAAVSPDAAGRAFNIGGFPPMSLKALAEALIAANGSGGYEIRAFPADRKKIDIGDYYADDSAFRALTGWRPRIDMAEGLARTLDYFRPNLPHYL
ncbi:MAG: NAD-dependent epimerase/dehydratase family protein [Alphaproteobacteria bacterium]